jgi:hypothetical protein
VPPCTDTRDLSSTAAGSQVGGEAMEDASESSEPTQEHQQDHQQHLITSGPSEDSTPTIPDGYRRRGEREPQDVYLNPTDTSLIISGKRNRNPKDLNNFSIQSKIFKVCYNPTTSWQPVLPTTKLPFRNVHSTPCIVVDKLGLHHSLARHVLYISYDQIEGNYV